MKDKPAKFQQFSQYLESGNPKVFLSELAKFNLQDQTHLLVYDKYCLLTKLKEQIDAIQLQQLMQQLGHHIDDYRLKSLFAAVQTNNYQDFYDHFRSLPIKERIPTLCIQDETVNKYSLFKNIYPRFNTEQMLSIIALLPELESPDERLIDVDNFSYRAEQLNTELDQYNELLRAALAAVKSDKETNKEKAKTVQAALYTHVTLGVGLELPNDTFMPYLKQFSDNDLPAAFFTQINAVPILLLLLRKQGSEALEKLFTSIKKQDEKALQEDLLRPYLNLPLYKHLLQTPGNHIVTVIDILLLGFNEATLIDHLNAFLQQDFSDNTELKRLIMKMFDRLDSEKQTSMVLKHVNSLSPEMILAILNNMASSARNAALLKKVSDDLTLYQYLSQSCESAEEYFTGWGSDTQQDNTSSKDLEATNEAVPLEALLQQNFSDNSETKRSIIKSLSRLDSTEQTKIIFKHYERMPANMIINILIPMPAFSRNSILMKVMPAGVWFYEYLLHAQNVDVSRFIECMKDYLDSGLVDAIMNSLAKNSSSPEKIDRVVAAIIPHIDDAIKSRLIFKHYKMLPLSAVTVILTDMSAVMRYNTLMTQMGQHLLIENIVIDSKDNLTPFLAILTEVQHAKTCFSIYTTRIQYGVKKVYTENSYANTAAGAVSSVASYIPGFGKHAKEAVQSLQREVPVYEFLLCRMVRSNPAMVEIIPALLSGLDPQQCTALLREPDKNGKMLLVYLLKSANKDKLLEIFGRLAFETDDDKKLLNPDPTLKPPLLDFDAMRIDLKDHKDGRSLIGFIGLLTVYNYLKVRGCEPNPTPYNESKDDFLSMLSVLHKNQKNATICQALRDYCSLHPLREAWGIPAASKTITLGTNRHKDARDKLFELTIHELQGGVALFSEFIDRRIGMDANDNPNTLDRSIQKTLKNAGKSISFSLS